MTVLPPPGTDGRWHYRRSLASRVTILTTLAAGATVALMALGAYVTVRMQLQSTLDDSLMHRAETTSTGIVCDTQLQVPPEYFGASDVWVACLDGVGNKVLRAKDTDEMRRLIGAPEEAVAKDQRHSSIRTVSGDGTRWRLAAVHRADGSTMVIMQPLDAQERLLAKLGTVMLLFGLAGVIGAGLAGWGVARNGLRPVRR
ncbi:two-component sensor histidine kinase, partial [Nocardioides hankookensis]